MSSGKFASITSSLLARKGEAMPWNGTPPERFPENRATLLRAEPRPDNEPSWRMEMPPLPPPHLVPTAPRRAPPHEPDDVRRCTVRLSQRDYERLGLMAVKKDVTRQQFLQSALARVLDEISREFPKGCACIGENCGGCGPGSRAG